VCDETTQENKNKRALEELRGLKFKPRFKEAPEVQAQRESCNQSILLSSLRPQRPSKKLSVQIDKRLAHQQQPSTRSGPDLAGHCLPPDYRTSS
jgi:hypothetical protein